MKHSKHVKALGLLALSCVIFTIGRITIDKIWGLKYDTHTIEVLIAVGIALHLVVPHVAKRLKRPAVKIESERISA